MGGDLTTRATLMPHANVLRCLHLTGSICAVSAGGGQSPGQDISVHKLQAAIGGGLGWNCNKQCGRGLSDVRRIKSAHKTGILV